MKWFIPLLVYIPLFWADYGKVIPIYLLFFELVVLFSTLVCLSLQAIVPSLSWCYCPFS